MPLKQDREYEALYDVLRGLELKMKRLDPPDRLSAGAYSLLLYLSTLDKSKFKGVKADVMKLKGEDPHTAWQPERLESTCPNLWRYITEALKEFSAFRKASRALETYWADRDAEEFVPAVLEHHKASIEAGWPAPGASGAAARYMLLVYLFTYANDSTVHKVPIRFRFFETLAGPSSDVRKLQLGQFEFSALSIPHPFRVVPRRRYLDGNSQIMSLGSNGNGAEDLTGQ
ncbi:hypothetical protein JCM3766R1_000171 [Sporobolomyces carnicolor]